MKRLNRIFLAVLGVACSVGVVMGLVRLGTAAQGPVTATLQRVGTVVSGTESRLTRRVRGPGRAQALDWLGALRTNADSLRNPTVLLTGAYDDRLPGSLDGVTALEEALATPFPLIQAYTAWGDAPEHAFPLRLAEAVSELGSIPVITWEPWLSTFENSLHPDLPLREVRERGGLATVARGDYDFYLDAWAAQAAAFGKPVLVRLAHEMNDPYRYSWGPQNNQPQDFIAAWRHVVDRFRAAGAHNVLWVWSPHVAYEGYEVYWPGEDYVDWVATGALNYGTVAYWSQWWSFEEIFGRHHDFLAGFGKPVMVAEFGTLAVGGDRAAWYASALEGFRARYPAVKGLLFFHVSGDRTVTRQAVDWAFEGDTAVVGVVRRALEAK